MTNQQESETITRLELEQWALGMLDPERTAALNRARQADPDLDQRMQRIKVEVDDASENMPMLRLPVEEDAPEPWWAWLFKPSALVVAGLTAAIALIVIVPNLNPDPAVDPGDRIRGMQPIAPIEVTVHRIRNGATAEAGATIRAREGDRIQYAVSMPASGYFAVYNLQDNGDLQPYMASRPVRAKEEVASAVILDDYPGSERIFFLFSLREITPEAVAGAVQREYRTPLADLDELPKLAEQQRSVFITKQGVR